MMSVLRLPDRRLLLILGGAIAPLVGLLCLGIWTIRQERELAEKRLNDDRGKTVSIAGQELAARLQTLILRAMSGSVGPADAEIALFASLESGTLRFPWHTLAPTDREERDYVEGQKAMSADPAVAIARLRQMSVHNDANVRAHALSLLAVALRRGGMQHEATAADTELYRFPPEATDEYGIPFFLYAAKRMVTSPERAAIVAKLETELRRAWIPATAAFFIADIARQAGPIGAPLERAALDRGKEIERAAALLGEASGDHSTFWRMSDDAGEPLLAGLSETRKTAIAVRADAVFNSIHLPAGVEWVTGSRSDGATAYDNAPQIKIRFGPDHGVESSIPRQILYMTSLGLITITTAFSALLLHRDIRRESRLAALRSAFVSSVSHELRTPIAAIRAYAEMLDLDRAEAAARPAYLKTIIGETERLSRLVEGVLEFSRAEQSKRVYTFHPMRLNEIVESAVGAMRYTLDQGGFEVRIRRVADPSVRGDRHALEQVFVNLLNNAVKYSGERREIDICVRLEDGSGIVEVRDYGVGIAAEDQQKIFERFYRVEDSTAKNVPGVGLGLSIVEEIVRGHGGRVAVESAPGRGSAFSVILPLEP
jgi:signal transduction histidine kinase